MILQALTRYYEVLLAQGRISAPGWGKAKVSFGLELAEDGTLLDVVSFLTEQARGKKMVLAPRVMEVPMPVKRSSGVAPNFLCDNSGYLLGADAKGKPQRTKECFEACRALHQRLLAGAGSPAARAVTAFFAGGSRCRPRPILCWKRYGRRLRAAQTLFSATALCRCGKTPL